MNRVTLPRRIGVVKPCCIGDCVMALPTLDSLAIACPSADLRVFVGPHSRPVFEGRRARWEIADIPDSITLQSAIRLASSVRSARFDLVVLLERSRLLRAAFQAIAGTLVAAVDVVAPETRHESVAYLDVLRGLGIQPEATHPVLHPSAADAEAASRALSRWPQPVILHPGGAENPGATMPDKRWPAGRYAELARTIEADGFDVLFTGSASERSLVQRVIAEAGLPPERSLAGQTNLSMAMAIVSRARLFVSGDTGMSHIAAASGTPVVAIFGPTNPRRYRPLGDRVAILAPEASWELPDADLRRSPRGSLPATDTVSVADAVAACRAALSIGVVAQ